MFLRTIRVGPSHLGTRWAVDGERKVIQRLGKVWYQAKLGYEAAEAEEVGGKNESEDDIKQADALDPEFGLKTVSQVLERLGTGVINILVNNAVLADPSKVQPVKDATLNVFLEVIQANVYAPYLPEYGGRVIDISSVLAYQANSDPTMTYGASKTTLQSFTRSFADSFSKTTQATLNSVIVGLTATDSIKAI